MLKEIDLNRLKTFYYVYRYNSISHAARELNVTPSAISQNLKKLEEETGVHLFTRMHKKLIPTSEAKAIIELIEPFFLNLNNKLKQFIHGKNEPHGMLNLGAPVEFGKTYLPKIISDFRKKYPQVTFSLTLGNQTTLLSMMEKGKLDFAIVDLFLNQNSPLTNLDIYHAEVTMDEDIIMACSRTYFEQNLQGDLSLENLLRQDFITYDHHYLAINSWFKHHFGKQTVKVNTVLMVDSVQAVLAAIENNIGLGVITSNQLHSKTVIPITTGKNEIVNKISLLQLKDKIPTFTEKIFLIFLKTALQNHS